MNSMMSESRLASIIARIPVLVSASNVTKISGGLTNLNYRVDTVNGTYLMRVSDTAPGILGISRENERVNTQRAWEAGVGPAVVDYLPNENVLVISWIDAKTLHAADIHSQPGLLKRIATSLKQLHSGPAFQGNFHFPAIRKRYLDTVRDRGYFLPDQYLGIEHLVLELEDVISETAEEKVPCNNDLLAENFMDDGKRIWVIDYEYSGQNEPSFEIGNLASEVSLGDEQLTFLCDAYWGQHIPSKMARAMAWSLIARYGWVMWASIQEAISSIDFDFRSWGMKKWNSVLPELLGSRYREVLQNLKRTRP